jgi:exodeoxyribonuclease V gamma subunit
LYVHRSERAGELVAMLADLVAEPLPDPMTTEVVSVPTSGIERWLTQRLSTRLGASEGRQDGVCANIDFPFPGKLIGGTLALAEESDPENDPWAPERAVWPLIEVVEEHFDEPWLAPLAQHIRNSATAEASTRFSSIRRVADLFDRYAVHRPDMLQRWVADDPHRDEVAWQVDLWRHLRDRIGQPSPAERLLEACERLRREPGLLDLPPRLSMFGLTRLAASHLDVLEAVADRRDVHLYLLHPSPALWDRVAGSVGPASRYVLRSEDPTARVPRNPLLSSWGRDAREMQLVMGGAVDHGPQPVVPADRAPRTLLERIQHDVRADRAPAGVGGGTDLPLLEPDDDSIRVHSCHGRGRQVEVLRDAILHLLEDDSTLESRDVIVMCPDIETFAPLIQATFGTQDLSDGSGDSTRTLQIRLADRSLRQTNPVMGVLAEVLELATSRVSATEVLDLAGRDPVRHRFFFSDEDIFRLEEWVEDAGVRWGFDAEHRQEFQLDGIGNNSWRSGLDRILLGVAMADERERLFFDTVPLDDVDSADIDLAGRLAEFIDRLQASLDALEGSRPVDAWAQTLAGISDSLTSTADRDAWQRAQLTTLLHDLVGEATTNGTVSAVELSCDDVRSILADRLRGRPTRANFCTGHLTVCTLVPMRSIPHRVVCLLGLDDGSFPRHTQRDGDDLTARRERVGDSDARSEDRQLLLDALLAAQEHLVITYSGRDERSNRHRPPAVPVGELLDVVDHSVRTPKGRPRDAIVISHPLQPFDARNYEDNKLRHLGPWSFDSLHLAGAQAALRTRKDAPPFLEHPLPPLGPSSVRVDQLEGFVRHPARAFLRERLKVSLRDKTRDFEDAIPIDLNALEQWQVADRLLTAQLAGGSRTSSLAAEVARGALPPDLLADPVLERITGPVDDLVSAGRSASEPTSLDVRVELDGGVTVVGTVAGLRDDTVLNVTYSKLGAAARLIAWVRLLAVTATMPERPFHARTVARASSNRFTTSTATIAPLGPNAETRKATALRELGVVVDLFRRGMCEPLPLYCKTSGAWAEAPHRGKSPERAAAGAWVSGFGGNNEDKDAEHELVLGPALSFAAMVERSGSPRADETGEGWDPSEPSRFGLYACRLWSGLLAREEVVER